MREGHWVTGGRALEETKARIQYNAHSAQDFIDAVDKLYPDENAFAPDDDRIRVNRKRLEDHVKEDWLIVNAQRFDDDAESTEEWKSRDIPPTTTVLTLVLAGSVVLPITVRSSRSMACRFQRIKSNKGSAAAECPRRRRSST